MLQAPIQNELKAHVLDLAPAIIAIHDTDHNIVWANKAYLKATGFSIQEIEGKKCYSAWRLDNPCRGCPVTLAIEDGEPHEAELTPQNQDHWPISQLSWLSKAVPLKDAEGRIIGAVETAHEISDRKQAEVAMEQLNTELETRIRQRTAELAESEEILRNAFDCSPIGMTLVAPDGRFLKANPALCRILGYSEEELLAKTFDDLTYTDDLDASSSNYRKLLAGGIDSFEIEKRYLHKEGHLVLAQLNVSLVRDNAGQPLFFIGQVQDITQRKQDQRGLRESKERYDKLSSQLNDVVWLASADGSRILELNHAFEKVFMISEDDFRSNPGLWFEMVHPEDKQIAQASAEELLTSGQAQAEYRIVRPDGEIRWIRDRKALITDQEGVPVQMGGIGTDITEIKNKEIEKEELQEQLLQAQKIEAVGRLASGVAHDFNNLLSVIAGYAELTLDEVNESDPIHGNLKEILAAASRSADLTRQLLAFARQQIISPEVLDLNAVVEGILKMLGRLIGEGIDLAWDPGSVLWPVKIDPAQVDQLLANLCVNAQDAIPDVGKITIETANVVFDEAYCAIHAGFFPGEYVMLAVSDDGCGMDKETRNQIFEPLFTTKQLGQGTGLGLATVYGIVKQNGGFINVYSEPGEGTTFHLYLSRHMGKADRVQKQSTTEIPHGNGETVLVVEDEGSILILTRKMLEGLGYTVLTAGIPGDALRLAEGHVGKIHLLITDVVMPEMNGRDLAGQLQTYYPDLKCLFMSGYTANVIAHHGVLEEGVHFIHKPVSKRNLAVKVREVLENSG
ncbi:MAG: PAS domain S-box protein [Desulfobacterales bacterium]|nr:PAS domain S-box protein [Desulfobacterales bacterium]